MAHDVYGGLIDERTHPHLTAGQRENLAALSRNTHIDAPHNKPKAAAPESSALAPAPPSAAGCPLCQGGRAAIKRRLWFAAVALAALLAVTREARCQVTVYAGATPIGTLGGYFGLNCGTGTTISNGTINCSSGGAVTSVFGRTGIVTAESGDYTTAQVTESGNLYFTTGRAQAALAGLYEVPLTFGAGLNRSTNTVTVPAGGITNAMLAGSIAASKLTGTDIATVGTITAGTWAGTPIAAAYVSTLNQNTTGNAATATQLAAAPTLCPSGQAPTGILASGNATGCAALTFPNASNTGSIIAAYVNVATATQTMFGEGQGYHACNSMAYWPVAGYARNLSAYTSAVNGNLNLRAGYMPDCTGTVTFGSVGIGPIAGGVIIAPGAATNSAVTDALQAVHIETGGILAAATTKQDGSGTAATILQLAAEFVDDAGVYPTVLAGSDNGHNPTASATTYMPVWGPLSIGTTTELVNAIPMPVAGTIQDLFIVPTIAPTSAAVYTLRKTGANQSVTVTQAATDSVPELLLDTTHSFTVAAGDYVSLGLATGASTQPEALRWGYVFTPSSGTHTIIGGQISLTIGTTAGYYALDSSITATTSAAASTVNPLNSGCSAGNLYVVMSTANGAGVTTTFALQDNGTDTAVAGSVTSSSGTGAIALYTGSTVLIAKGHKMSLHVVSSGGTSGTIGGWAATCN